MEDIDQEISKLESKKNNRNTIETKLNKTIQDIKIIKNTINLKVTELKKIKSSNISDNTVEQLTNKHNILLENLNKYNIVLDDLKEEYNLIEKIVDSCEPAKNKIIKNLFLW